MDTQINGIQTRTGWQTFSVKGQSVNSSVLGDQWFPFSILSFASQFIFNQPFKIIKTILKLGATSKQSTDQIWPVGYTACRFLDFPVQKQTSPYPVNSIPSHLSNRNENVYDLTKTCTTMFIETLFLIAPKQKPQQCP